jgi:quinone-modifying oxidoreductase subunit QmoC
MNGFAQGVKTSLKMQKVGQGLFFSKRMDPTEILGGHGCKDSKGLRAALDKARQIEENKTAQSQS